MIIYIPLIITVLCIIVLYAVPQFRKKVAWWETSLMLLVSVLAIIGAKALSEHLYTSDTEYLIDNISDVYYHEYWNEWIDDTCENCSTDSDGNTTCTTYDCSYEEEHYPYTEIITVRGKSINIDEGFKPRSNDYPSMFFELVEKLKAHPKVIKTHKNDINTDYGRNFQGEVHHISWDKSLENSEYFIWEHKYENRVQNSNSIEKFESVDSSDIIIYGLYEYPEIYNYYHQDCILGYNSIILEDYLNKRNAKIGYDKQLKIFFLVFYDKTIQAAYMQQRHFGGGNKNEVNICIGINSHTKEIMWSNVFSWSKKENFKIEIRDYINTVKYLNEKSFKQIIDYSVDNLYVNFHRREFVEFDYLTIEPPTWALVISFVITLLISIGGSIWIIMNEYE